MEGEEELEEADAKGREGDVIIREDKWQET
jgi:hypothetical protein